MSDSAKDSISYLNGITLQAIDEIEQLLLNLPKAGSKCEIQFIRSFNPKAKRGTADVINPGSLRVKDVPKPLALSPPQVSSANSTKTRTTTQSSTSTGSSKSIEYRTITSVVESVQPDGNSDLKMISTEMSTKVKYKVLADKIKVSPIASMSGVVLDIDVEINISENEKKIIKLEIECPDYIPSRIKVGGKWKRIV